MSVDAYVCTRDMNVQDNFIVIAATVTAAVVLVSAIFISTVDVCHQQSLPDLFNAEEDKFDFDVSCDPCPNNSTFYHIGVLKGNQSSSRSYMFVDLVDFPSNSCCNVIAKPTSEIDLTDIRGKRVLAYNYITRARANGTCFHSTDVYRVKSGLYS